MLARNDDLARRNRDWFAQHAITALNVMSSPGAGKTTLLARTIGELGGHRAIEVTEGADKPLKYPHMFRTPSLVLAAGSSSGGSSSPGWRRRVR